MTEHALDNIKVLDLTHYLAGPYCTRLLAGFGAEVIKIERPGEGDPARRMGPFLDDMPGSERSGLFLYLNNNKKSITLNVKSRRGAEIFREMVGVADVVVENFRPGVMERLGIDYLSLEKINPRLVMTSISNFGQSGPYRDYRSAHIVTWGMSGAEPMRRPVQGPGWLTHYIAGVYGAAGTAVALYQCNETGAGQHIDVSMLESMMLMNLYPATGASYAEAIGTSQLRDRRDSAAMLRAFHCKDGIIGLNVYQMTDWEKMCTLFEVPELIDDPRFGSLIDIRNHLQEARDIFAPLVKDREKLELMQSGQEWRIPFSIVANTKEILESPQHKARSFFEKVDHPVMGKVTIPGAPFKMSETPWQLRNPAPMLGEHNEEIYCQRLGYSKEQLVKLREQKVI